MEEVNLLDFVDVLRRRWLALGIVFVLVVGVGGAYSILGIPRTYSACTSIIVTTDTRSGLSMAMMASGATANIPGLSWLNLGRPQSQWQFMSILSSETMRRDVARKLNLAAAFGVPDEAYAAVVLKKSVAVTWTETGAIAISATCAGTPRGLFPSVDDDMETRKLAADIANAYIEVLEDWLRENAIDETGKQAESARKQLERAKGESRKAQEELAAYKEEHGIVELSSQVEQLIAEHTSASIELVAAQGVAKAAKAEYDTHRATLRDIYREPAGVLPPSPELADLEAAWQAKEADWDAAKQIYTDEHQTVIRLRQEADALKAKYEQALARAGSAVAGGLDLTLVGLDAKVKAADARASTLQSKLRELEAELAKGPAMELEYGRLAMDAQSKEAIANQLSLQAASYTALAGDAASRFTVLDEAFVPLTRTKPKLKVNLAVAMAMGLFLGCVVVAFREMSARRRVRGPSAQADPAPAPTRTSEGE